MFEAPCIELGRIPASKACNKHSPDVFSIFSEKEGRVDNLVDFARILSTFGGKDLQVFAAILLQEKKTRKAGWHFMQKVHIRLGPQGRNYINNFVTGFVLDANKERVRVVSSSGKTSVTCINEKGNSSTLYTVEEFESLYIDMLEARAYKDSMHESKLSGSSTVADLDTADRLGALDLPIMGKKKIKKIRERDDLITLVSKLSRGLIRTKSEDYDSAPRRKKKKYGNHEEEITLGRR